MTTEEIANHATEAAQACFRFYTGRKLCGRISAKIYEIILNENPEESVEHSEYSQKYHERVGKEKVSYDMSQLWW